MNVLVTGASGFVGGALVARLARIPGVRVHGTGRRPRPARDADYTAIDLAQPFTLPVVPDVVVHCAARASPWGTRAEFEAANVTAVRNLLAFCERNGRPRVVYVSTSAVFYRAHDQYDLTEESPIGPAFVNAYARTKYAGERLVAAYAGSSVVVRPRAVFGPGDTTLLPRLVRAARLGQLPWFRRAGPPATADLIYIDSLSDYLIAAALATHGGAFNVTNAEPVETQAFIAEVLQRLGIPLPRRSVDARVAYGTAAVLEAAYRVLPLGTEPPITRFGVGALAHAKTFNVRKAIAAFGPPSVSLRDGLERTLQALGAAP